MSSRSIGVSTSWRLPAMTTPSPPSLLDGALAGVREQFAGHDVEVVKDEGGAVVIVENIFLGEQYEPSRTWFGFRITGAYPYADVYPHYIGRVVRKDGAAHGAAVQFVDWQSRPALQLSRRSNGWNPSRDTAALKAAKVLAWFADQ